MSDDLSRRALLKSTGIFAIIGASVGGASAATGLARPRAMPTGEIISTLSSYMAQAGTRQLPNDVIEKTRHVIFDTFAAMISGSELPPGKFAIQFARAYKGDKVATV